MQIKEIISDSITFPFSNPVRFFTLGVILIFSPLFLPLIIAGGYLLRIIKSTSEGKREMPPFDDISNMFIDGVKFLVVNLAYSIPGIIFIYAAFMISIFTSLGSMISSGHVNNQTIAMYSSPYTINYLQMFNGTLPLSLLAIGILLIALGYMVQIIAIPRIVYKNSLGAAFDIKTIYKEIKMLGKGNYLICGIFFLIIIGLTTIIGLGLSNIFNAYGLNGYIISLVIAGLFVSSFEYAFQGRFMGLVYPGEVENEDDGEPKKTPIRKPRFEKPLK